MRFRFLKIRRENNVKTIKRDKLSKPELKPFFEAGVIVVVDGVMVEGALTMKKIEMELLLLAESTA